MIVTFGRFNADKQYQEFSILCYVFIVVCVSINKVSPIIYPIARSGHLCNIWRMLCFLWWLICLSEFRYVIKITLNIGISTSCHTIITWHLCEPAPWAVLSSFYRPKNKFFRRRLSFGGAPHKSNPPQQILQNPINPKICKIRNFLLRWDLFYMKK